MEWAHKLLAMSAVVDDELMARQSVFSRRRHAIIGGTVILNALLAGGTWGWRSFVTLPDNPYRLPLAVAVGVFACVGMWQIERILIGSIKPAAGIVSRLFGFILRVPIAALMAALVGLPVVLGDFGDEIFGLLDDRRVSLLQAARTRAEEVFELPAITSGLANLDQQLQANRAQREQLPLDVREVGAQSVKCAEEARILHASLQQRIQNLTAQISYWRQRMSDGLEDAPSAQGRINWLNSEINNLKRALAAKDQACTDAAARFDAARTKYFAEIDRDRKMLAERRQALDAALQAANSDARDSLELSKRAIARRTAPGILAQGQALYELVENNLFDRIVVVLYFCFFMLLDLLPILSKVLPAPSDYERRMAERDRKVALEVEANLATAKVETSVRKLEAKAILAAAKRFHRDPQTKSFYELSRHRFELYVEKALANNVVEQIDAALAGVHEVLGRIDQTERRYAQMRTAMSRLEPVHQMLDRALMKMTGIFGRRLEDRTTVAPAE